MADQFSVLGALDLPVKIGDIQNRDIYYKGFSGSQLVFQLLDSEKNVISRGMGMSWSENYQQTPVMEWGQRRSFEIITGAMPVGQISINSLYFLQLNDTLPTVRNLSARGDFMAIVQIGSQEDPAIAGLILDVYKGVKIVGQQGNWNAQSLYLRNANMMYCERLSGAEYALENGGSKYDKIVSVSVSMNFGQISN